MLTAFLAQLVLLAKLLSMAIAKIALTLVKYQMPIDLVVLPVYQAKSLIMEVAMTALGMEKFPKLTA
jgi:hypothetical protein